MCSIDEIRLELNLQNFNFALEVKYEVEEKCEVRGVKPRRKHYPACVSTGVLKNSPVIVAKGCSGQMICRRSLVTTFLDSLAFHLQGKIGGKSSVTGCKNSIGNCAEQHVARSLWGIDKSQFAFNDIIFSIALRPRTRSYIPPCDNCRYLFHNVI